MKCQQNLRRNSLRIAPDLESLTLFLTLTTAADFISGNDYKKPSRDRLFLFPLKAFEKCCRKKEEVTY